MKQRASSSYNAEDIFIRLSIILVFDNAKLPHCTNADVTIRREFVPILRIFGHRHTVIAFWVWRCRPSGTVEYLRLTVQGRSDQQGCKRLLPAPDESLYPNPGHRGQLQSDTGRGELCPKSKRYRYSTTQRADRGQERLMRSGSCERFKKQTCI